MIEISQTKTKLIIIAARKLQHHILEYPLMQGKKIVKEIGEGWLGLAQNLRISTGKTLYIENLQRLLYPPVRSEMGKVQSPEPKPRQIIKYLERIS